MEKAEQYQPTRLFYLLLACTLSGIGLLTLFKIASTASAANPPNHQVQGTATGSLQTTTHYTPTLQFLTSMGGDYGDIVIAGEYAYIGNGSELSVVDIHDLGLAHTVKLLRLPASIYDLQTEAGYLYVAAGYGGLLIYDLSNPAAPKLLTRLQDEFPYYHLYPSGGILLAVTAGSFQALDVSQPVAPHLLDEIEADYSLYNKLFVQGSYAYTGKVVVNVADPQALSIAAELEGFIREVDETYAIVDTASCNIHCFGTAILYDITNPHTPLRLGETHFQGTQLNVARIEGDLLYQSDNSFYRLTIWDISQPLSPTWLCTYDSYVSGLEVSGDHLTILGNGLEILDTSNPTNPVVLDSYKPVDYTLDYARSGDIYLLRMLDNEGRHRSLHILDTDDPEDIIVLGFALPFSGMRFVNDFRLEGNIAYILQGLWEQNFQVWDFQNATSPVYLGGTDESDYGVPGDLELTANRAYFAAYHLVILDISDPTEPISLMVYGDESNFIEHVRAISNDQVYVMLYNATGDLMGRLQIVDFSAAPDYKVLGIYAGSSGRFVTALEGSPAHAYLGWMDGQLEILDTSNPVSPTLTGVYSSTGEFTSLRLYDDLLFTGFEGKLEIVDVSDPYSPTLLSQILISGTVEDTTVSDGWAFLSMGENGMLVYDVSDTASPVFYQRYPISTYNVQVIGGLAYLSTADNGLQFISLYEPSVYLPYVQFNSP